MKYEGRLYKVLDNLKSCHGGNHVWTPGEWVQVEGILIPCQRGIHLCRDEDLIDWLGPEIWAAEYQGEEFIISDKKVVVRQARITTKYENWNERSARLLACDFADRVVHLCGDDPRPQEAIRVSRLFANGEATVAELAAAWDAARAAARAAARDAARDAARAASRAASRAAARAAAWDAARAAAWDAARDASRAAARAAAWDAARDAAWDAAKDAERQWQSERLIALLHK